MTITKVIQDHHLEEQLAFLFRNRGQESKFEYPKLDIRH